MEENNRIGALWLKEAKSGTKYMSGNIEIDGKKIYVAVFRNNKDGKEARPDYVILRSEMKQQKPEPKQEAFEDDIPF